MEENKYIAKEKIIPLLGNCDDFCKYNAKNISRMIKERRIIPSVLYHPQFKEYASEAGVANFFTRQALKSQMRDDLDGRFVKGLEYLDKRIDDKLDELKLKA